MKPPVGYMDLKIPDDVVLFFVVNFLPFVRGGLRWGRILRMKFKMSVCTPRNVDGGLMFLPPLNPSLQRKGKIATRDFNRLEENAKLVVSL